MQTYHINEIFDSIQGEGADTGMPVTFVRFAGCNLRCTFCDTSFADYVNMTIEEIVPKCLNYVVFTGGEPLLYSLKDLAASLRPRRIGIETNGTMPVPSYLANCSISLSPKIPRSECEVERATSLKILYPYLPGVNARDWRDFPAPYRSLQLIDPEKGVYPELMSAVMDELKVLGNGWRFGIQLHKMIGVK